MLRKTVLDPVRVHPSSRFPVPQAIKIGSDRCGTAHLRVILMVQDHVAFGKVFWKKTMRAFEAIQQFFDIAAEHLEIEEPVQHFQQFRKCPVEGHYTHR